MTPTPSTLTVFGYGASGFERRFALRTSAAALHHDPQRAYQASLFGLITNFLNSDLIEDERAYFS